MLLTEFCESYYNAKDNSYASTGMKMGYARVSTTGQSSDGQVEQLKAAGCGKVFQETASGAKTNREALAKLVASLQPGDIVVVTRLDRLARSTLDLLMILKAVADREALFVSLAEHWADTTTAAGRLMLTILGGLAEFERSRPEQPKAENGPKAEASEWAANRF
jgi:DNA invertase Pin-like site-specific DNA recombinase